MVAPIPTGLVSSSRLLTLYQLRVVLARASFKGSCRCGKTKYSYTPSDQAIAICMQALKAADFLKHLAVFTGHQVGGREIHMLQSDMLTVANKNFTEESLSLGAMIQVPTSFITVYNQLCKEYKKQRTIRATCVHTEDVRQRYMKFITQSNVNFHMDDATKRLAFLDVRMCILVVCVRIATTTCSACFSV
jgi:hypothetical protein